MHKSLVMRLTIAIGAIAVAACVYDAPIAPTGNTITAAATSNSPSLQVAAPNGSKSYLINFSGSSLPADLAARVAAAGGTVTSSLDRVGVALASSTDPAFATRAARISGVASVDEDIEVQWVTPEQFVEAGDVVDEGVVTPTAPTGVFGIGETFRQIEWGPDAVHAPQAWDAGQRGAGARVAVLDGGIWNQHIDIAPRLDVAHSRSFVPNQPYNFDRARNAQGQCVLNDTFWHGTHVAGIIAAPATVNTPFPNLGTVGIAPDATIIGVKVLHCGSGTFGQVISGIYYAATPIADGGAGADIINMSLGAFFARQGVGAARLAVALGKATTYAYQNGVTVIAALGNNAADLDHTANLVFLPAMSPHVIAVAATGPFDFAHGAVNYDRPASYTNFGQSATEFAGPGGDFALPGNDICTYNRNTGPPIGLQFCWALDMVIAPCRGAVARIDAYCWAAGTSMASPAVAGVAALIVGRFGHVSPAEVERRLRQSADDLGKPGNDDFYGRGRVNAARAIQ
jgi:lantibiotic leader peptide-processing serine protease